MRLRRLAIFAAGASWVFAAVVFARVAWNFHAALAVATPTSWGSITLTPTELAAIPLALLTSLVAHAAAAR